MAATTQIAKRFLAAAAQHPVEKYMNCRPIAHLFKNLESEMFAQFDGFVSMHSAMPSKTLLEEWWDVVPPAPDPPSYYLGILRNRHMQAVLQRSVEEANQLVAKDQSEAAAKQLIAVVMPELVRSNGSRLVNITEAYGMVKQNYFNQVKQGDDYGVKLGYPVVDDYGGLIGGDIMSIVGRPAAGKSFLQLRGAHRAWKQGKRACLLSMEMNNMISAQRLVAMDAGIPLNALKLQSGQGLSTPQMKKMIAAGESSVPTGQDFLLMDGNLSTTVEDIYRFCQMMHPDVLFIDGAYMLKHENPRIGRFERVAENCELLKQRIAGDLGIPVVASWQFSRDAAKKMKGNHKGQAGKVDLEDIGYSDAIGQISSIVLGMLAEETVETMVKKQVTIMKGRSGETGSFWINWQFNPTLNFDHFQEVEVGDIEFIA